MSRTAEKEGRGRQLSGRYCFLLTVLAAYAVAAFLQPALAVEALTGFVRMLGNVVPILAVVFAFLLLVNLVGTDRIRRHLGRESGWKGWLYAALGGIFITGPPYILYPLLGELRKQGVRDAFLGVILYNRNVKIPFVPAMVYYFGASYTLVLSTYIILFSFVNGKVLELLVRRHN